MEKSKGPQGGPSSKQSRLSTCVGQHCNSYYTGFTPAGKQGQQRIGVESHEDCAGRLTAQSDYPRTVSLAQLASCLMQSH